MTRFFQSDPGAPPGRPSAGVTCDFCGCGLAGDGAVLRTSPRAKELARVDEKLERLTEDLTAARAKLADVEGQLAAAVAKLAALPPAPDPPAPAARGLHFNT